MNTNIKEERFSFDILLYALLALTTWIFKIPQEINLIIYSVLVFILILFKTKPIKLIMFSLFSLIGSYNALNFYEVAQKIFSEKLFLKLETLLNLSNGQPAFIVYYIILIIILVYFIVLAIKRGLKAKLSLLLPIVGLLSISFISIFWGGNKSVGLMFMLVMIQGLIFYYFIGLLEDDISFKEISWFLSLFLLVVSIQYIYLVNLHVNKIMDPDIIYSFTDKFKLYFKYDNKAHLSSLWGNQNMVAAMLGVSLFPSYYKYFVKDGNKFKYLYLPLELLVLFAVYASMSDGLLFAIGFTILFIVPTLIFKNKKIVYYLFLFAVAGFITFVVLVVNYQVKYPELFDWLNVETTYRFSIYKIGISLLSDPKVILFGKGLGSSFETLDSNYYYHSWFLHNLINSGVISLGFTLFMIYKTFVIYNKNRNNLFTNFMLLGSITYLFHGLFDISYDYQFVGLLYYSLVALVEKKGIMEEGVFLLESKN